MTQADYLTEELANQQLKAAREVLRELQDLAGVNEPPHEFYWFRYVDFVRMDRYGNLESWFPRSTSCAPLNALTSRPQS